MSTKVKVLTAFILGSTLTGGAVYAATIVFNADQVGFDNTNTSLSSTNIQDALDELYTKTSTWVDPTTVKGVMQNFDKTTLVNIGDSANLIDTRDGNVYTVKKLADGNVWMTQNLRIVDKTITPADSDVSSDYTIPASSISGFSIQEANNAYVDDTYGGYYNYYTATAGWGTQNNMELYSYDSSAVAPYSICPKGWRLPTGGSGSEFETLYNNYNSLALLQGEPGIDFPGYINNSTHKAAGSRAGYWSSSVYTYDAVKVLLISSSTVHASDYALQADYGYSVRCIAR